ncbi:MAG: hypothetical protein ACREPH_09925 [Rhodanobacteraceae bacterium]
MNTPTPHEGDGIARLAGSVAGCLAYTAAPAFALMALVSAGATSSMTLCPAMPGSLPLDGMTAMYLLMSLFHLRPWLKLAGAAKSTPHH